VTLIASMNISKTAKTTSTNISSKLRLIQHVEHNAASLNSKYIDSYGKNGKQSVELNVGPSIKVEDMTSVREDSIVEHQLETLHDALKRVIYLGIYESVY